MGLHDAWAGAVAGLGRSGSIGNSLMPSTEEARSWCKAVEEPGFIGMQLTDVGQDHSELQFVHPLLTALGRNLPVYGTIAVRSDGKRVVVAE